MDFPFPFWKIGTQCEDLTFTVKIGDVTTVTTPILSAKWEEMCQLFKTRAYPDSAVTTGKHRAQEIDPETPLHTSQNVETNRIPFTLS